MELEAEETWLRKRIIRLRTVLRYANDPRTEAGLREFIADAEPGWNWSRTGDQSYNSSSRCNQKKPVCAKSWGKKN